MQNQMHTLSIVGAFSPSNDKTINADTRRTLNEIFAMAGLGGLILKEQSETGVINLNKSVSVSHPQAPISLIRKIQEIIAHPSLAGYEFTGKITIVFFGVELTGYSILITRGSVTYRKATMVWKGKPIQLTAPENSTFTK